MKRNLTHTTLLIFSLVSLSTIAYGTCGDTWAGVVETSSGSCANPVSGTPGTLIKTLNYAHLYWLDGYERPSGPITDTGQVGYAPTFGECPKCWPRFDTPYFEENGSTAYWVQKTYRASINLNTNACSTSVLPTFEYRHGHTCPAPGQCRGTSDYASYPSTGCIAGLYFMGPCTRSNAFRSRCDEYIEEDCSCSGTAYESPIVIDVDHSGFALTSAANGVVFNFLDDGVPLPMAWTVAGSSNSWLVLDRNGNGTIDNGKELFGDVTPQPPSAAPNGFLALALFDAFGNGGNENGKIDRQDAIYSQLRLWRDLNHNGISESSELQPLAKLIRAIDLDYKESRRTDQFGNRFRYRAKVYDARGEHAGRWAWDVLLTIQ